MEINGSQVLIASLAGAIALLIIGLSAFFLARGILLKTLARSASIFAGRPAEFVLIIHAIALAIIIGFFYSALFEPGQLVKMRYSVKTSKLREPITLCFISDLKWPRCGLELTELVDSINNSQPDIVLFCGDMVINEHFDEASDAFAKIKCPRKFGCTGNYLPQADVDFYVEAGITQLFGKGLRTFVDKQQVFVFGAESLYDEFPYVSTAPINLFSIIITHSPELIPVVNSNNYDLYLCGHTLGGQVRLPFLSNMFVPGEFASIYPYGQFEVGGMSAIVSKGLGMSPDAPKMRLFCPPEVVIVDVMPTGTNTPETP